MSVALCEKCRSYVCVCGDTDNAGSGYYCATCGAWVGAGITHYCQGYISYPTYPISAIFTWHQCPNCKCGFSSWKTDTLDHNSMKCPFCGMKKGEYEKPLTKEELTEKQKDCEHNYIKVSKIECSDCGMEMSKSDMGPYVPKVKKEE